MFLRNRGAVGVFLGLMLLLTACAQKMRDQPSLKPDEPSHFAGLPLDANFSAGTSSLPPVSDTVARGYTDLNSALYTGKDAQGNDVTQFPFPITMADIQRGQNRFNIYCAPCHGILGNGGGVVIAHGFTGAPTYHQDRLRNAPVGHIFDVATRGLNTMPSYANQISPQDRWRIVAYIRALQFSDNAPYNQLPPEDQQAVQKAASGG
jgi:mono/diheme cytochrome c family protein